MRPGLSNKERERFEIFAKWLLDVGNDFIYNDATLKAPTASALREKAIVCPKNDTVDAVNVKIVSTVKSAMKTYLSRDEAILGGKPGNVMVFSGIGRQLSANPAVKKENMRPGLSNKERERFEIFAKWLLDVGNDFIYNDATLKAPTASALREKAIVYPKNDTADAVNVKIVSTVKSAMKTYLSRDEAILVGRDSSEIKLFYPIEYLNTITFPCFPPYELQLKVGSPIILLQNVNLSGGLCNGIRLIDTSLMSRLIEAQIITGTKISEKVFIHRIPLSHKDPNISFTFKHT
nr:DNA helicase [Tanacetum cinerariifolium]